jgi:photosystem II stability/assembly factor-like uncharacterized protein
MRYSRIIKLTLLLTSIWISNGIAQWVQGIGSGGALVMAIASNDTYMYASCAAGVLRSSDSGGSWTLYHAGMVPPLVVKLAITRTSVFAIMAMGGGVYRSRDQGVNWERVSTGLPNGYLTDAAVVEGTVFVNTAAYGLYRSIDDGDTWTQITYTFPPDNTIDCLLATGTNLYVGTSAGIYLSMDKGDSWTAFVKDPNLDVAKLEIYSLAISGTALFASSPKGIYVTTDNGVHWSLNASLNSFRLFANDTLIVAATGSAVRFSWDCGTTWKGQTISTIESINDLNIRGPYLYAGLSNGGNIGGVWRRPLSEMVTSVHTQPTDGLGDFTLMQNYPNPFNPSTTISFTLPSRSFVTLKIFDVMGREVATIVSEEMQAGSYSRSWNASTIPSGAYFYRLHAGAYTKTKRFVLLK